MTGVKKRVPYHPRCERRPTVPYSALVLSKLVDIEVHPVHFLDQRMVAQAHSLRLEVGYSNTRRLRQTLQTHDVCLPWYRDTTAYAVMTCRRARSSGDSVSSSVSLSDCSSGPSSALSSASSSSNASMDCTSSSGTSEDIRAARPRGAFENFGPDCDEFFGDTDDEPSCPRPRVLWLGVRARW